MQTSATTALSSSSLPRRFSIARSIRSLRSYTGTSTTPGGNVYAVSVTMKNTGNTTWTAGTGYRLGSLDPQSYWQVVEAALPNAVAPGQNVTFSFNITSPAAWGTYPIRYTMRKGEPYGWFGAMTGGSIVNGVNESQFVAQSVPGTMSAGSGRDSSHTTTSVEPMRCQPPGLADG